MSCFVAHYASPLGGITLASDGAVLTVLWFDGQKHFANTIGAMREERQDLAVFMETRRWLDVYFSGMAPDFIPPLRMTATPFRKAVWEVLLTIPFGTTMTYGDIARRIGCRSAQAVGGAVGRNPISLIVPCHRVVAADGSLTGYAAGLERKRRLLEMEREAFPVLHFLENTYICSQNPPCHDPH